MTTAIDILMTEHRFIEKVLGSLESCAQSPTVERRDVARYAEFFREFADHCHHGKEENHLFATLHRQGMPLQQGPLAVMLHEHELGRGYTQALTALGAGDGPLDAAERRQLRETAQDYSQLLRAHIQKEDNILFPLAGRVLPADSMQAVTDDFIRFEEQHMGEGVHARLHAMAEALIAAYPPAAG